VQAWLNHLPYNTETGAETLRSFRGVVRSGRAHCLEAALSAATILEQHRYPPLVLSFESIDLLDHVIFVYRGPCRMEGRWRVARPGPARAAAGVRRRAPGPELLRGLHRLHRPGRHTPSSICGCWADTTGGCRRETYGRWNRLLDWRTARLPSADARADRMRRRYVAFREAHGYKPWK
jgi:hypothetical protein